MDARKVIERAAEIEKSRQPDVSVESIRSAALEAGIDPAAVEQAIREQHALSEPELTESTSFDAMTLFKRLRPKVRKLFRAMLLGGIAFLVGLTAGPAEAVLPIGALAWIVFAFRLAREQRLKGSVGFYQLSIVYITLGAGLGLGIAGEQTWVGYALLLGLATFLIGTMSIVGISDDAD